MALIIKAQMTAASTRSTVTKPTRFLDSDAGGGDGLSAGVAGGVTGGCEVQTTRARRGVVPAGRRADGNWQMRAPCVQGARGAKAVTKAGDGMAGWGGCRGWRAMRRARAEERARKAKFSLSHRMFPVSFRAC